MVAEPPAELRAIAKRYVCVKVLDMSRVDLNDYRFDYDLTFAALLMHGDGTVFHRYGGRDERPPTDWNDLDGLTALMRATLEEHASHRPVQGAAPEAEQRDARYVVDLPPLRRKLQTNPQLRANCVHCHTVHETLHRVAVDADAVDDDTAWVYPPPARLGLTLDTADQARLAAVAEDSPAAAAGLRAGDRLLSVGVQPRVLTIADLSFALHEASPDAHPLRLTWQRGDEVLTGALDLPDGWKHGTVAEYAWRPYKWGLSPAPGFGGQFLERDELRRLDLSPDARAFRVTYIVTWGDKAHRGRTVARAGLRNGDIVLRYAGRDDFASMDEFHAWVRLTRRAGEEVEVVYLRDGRRHTLSYRLPE